jgi:hypothetical protein
MANELVLPPGNASGLTVTAKVYSQAGVQVGSDVSCTEVGSTSVYRGNMPTASQGVYLVRFDSSAGAFLGTYEMNWDGSAERTVFDNATASAITGLNNLSASDVTGAVPTVSAIQNGLATEANLNAVKAKTDGLNFIGTDVKSTLNGELVTTDTASQNASKADISSLATASALTQAVNDLKGSSSKDLTDVFNASGASDLTAIQTAVNAIKQVTDALTITNGDVQATLAGETLSAQQLGALKDIIIEGTLSVEHVLRIMLAVLANKAYPDPSDATKFIFRDLADTKNRVYADACNGSRTTVTVDGT